MFSLKKYLSDFFQTYMLELSLSRGAGGGVLAHTHGGVALIDLTHFALLAVVVQAGICEKKSTNTEAVISQEMAQPNPDK